jgi:AraC family transcriptional regulator
MLRHMAVGIRRFGLYPMYVHQRDNWEFFAVLRGKCGAVLAETQQPPLRHHYLWVFPPETAHGWKGEGTSRCNIAVFHFGNVPPLLEKITRERGYLECELTPNQVRRLTDVLEELRVPYGSVTEKSLMLFDKALLELSLIALTETPFSSDQRGVDYALEKVQECITWYNEHMPDQPKLEHAAQAINISVRHLRRLFRQAGREGPLETFTRLRLERAMGLLSLSNLKLDDIARQCGFSGSSDFCRVFKAHRHLSPDAWRKKHLPAYEEPAATRK